MLTVTLINGNLKVHIRQFYVNEDGETKAGRIGITLSVEEFTEFVPQVQYSIARYELRDTGISSPFAVFQAKPIFPDLDSIFCYHCHHLKILFLPFETMNFWTAFPNLHCHHRPFLIYHCWSILLWKRFCLILVQRKDSRDIIKTLC